MRNETGANSQKEGKNWRHKYSSVGHRAPRKGGGENEIIDGDKLRGRNVQPFIGSSPAHL